MGLSLILKPSTGELGEYETENKDYFLGRCQDHVFTMLKPHLAYIYFQMSKSSENVKTESIRSKEYVYGVSNFWDPFGLSLDQVGTVFSLPLLLSIFLNNLVSLLFFFTYLLKFYSGGAVDLWSCFD